jgi:polysaccharide biosynthesis protein PelD
VVPDTGRIIGMLKIEKLGFLDLTFSNVQTLKVLCQWIGAAYENAVRYQAARSESVVNTETELFAYSFLSRQLSFLTLLARRVGFDLTMIVVRLENPDSLTEEQRILVPRAFSHAASQALRKTDMAFDYQRTGSEFAIVLPAAPVQNAHVVIGKLAGALKEKLALEAPDARFSFGVHAIHEMTPAKEEHLELQSV